MNRAYLLCLCLLGMLLSAVSAPAAEPAKLWVYIGTYTGPKSKGIYRAELDLAAGTLNNLELAGETANPSFLAIHPSKKFLYAVGEVGTFNGKKSGVVTGFAIDPKTGKLTQLNQQPSEGTGPCHISVDKAGKNALVANYGGGSVAAIPIQADGKMAAPSSAIQHKGTSVDKSRQGAPHAHSINLDVANRFVFAADLGLDKVLVYRFDPVDGKLTANDPPSASVDAGSGPRHFAFHPSGKYAYVINEMANTVTAFSYDAEKGVLTPVQTITTLPADFKGKTWTAEVQVHPSGKFLYGSNRGHNSIAIFTIDQTTGKLTAAGHEPTQGKTPRNFGIDPTGKFLLAANQDSANVVVFRIDGESGLLKPTGSTVTVSAPVCLKFMSAP